MTTKIIKVNNCQSCPYYGKCDAWTALKRKERVRLLMCNDVPNEFILAKCHLEDDKS